MAKIAKKFWLDQTHIKKLARLSKKKSESQVIRDLLDNA